MLFHNVSMVPADPLFVCSMIAAEVLYVLLVAP